MNILEARKKLGLTQEDLAKVVGVKKTAVCNWEKGLSKPRGKVAKKIAVILEIPLENII